MALYDYLNRIEQLDGLIRKKRTGPPKELAQRLDISERWLYYLLEELKTELDCPIRYDRRKRSYIYETPGRLKIGFIRDAEPWQLEKVNGGKSYKLFRLYV